MLPALEGYAAALLGSLDAASRATVVADLEAVEETVLARGDLRAVLADTSLTGAIRALVLTDLLSGKVAPVTLRLLTFAARAVPAQEVARAFAELTQAALRLHETGALEPTNLGLLEARRRVGGYADALLEDLATGEFATLESELFAWARTIEGNADLRRLLTDRDAARAARVEVTDDLLATRVAPVTAQLARYVVIGGRPRDVVGTLDYLVEHVARARDWRVARVHSARSLDASVRASLSSSLSILTGHDVELQVAEEPDLLGGVLVEVGDLRLDATMRGRLQSLHDEVAAGHFHSSFAPND